VLQARQDLALGLESFQLRSGFALQQLDGDSLLEFPIRTGRFVHLAHAAPADEPSDVPRTQAHAEGRIRHEILRGRAIIAVEKFPGCVRRQQQTLDLGKYGRVLYMPAAQLCEPCLFGQIEQFIQQRIDSQPLLRRKASGGRSA
jgi:hypothetical protein